MATPSYKQYIPNLKPETKALKKISNFSLPKKRLQKIGSRAAQEARTASKNQQTSLDNLRRSISRKRTAARNQLQSQEAQLPKQFQSNLQSALQSAITGQNKRGPVKSAGLTIQDMLAGGAQAQAQNLQNLSKITGQQSQVEQTYAGNLVNKVMDPRAQLAQKTGQNASTKYNQYINAAKQAVYNGHVNKAQDLLTKAQREYNNNIQGAQNKFQQWSAKQQNNVSQAQMAALQKLANQTPMPGDNAKGGNVDTWLTKAIQATGVPMSWLPGLKIIAMHESSGNPRAINKWDSNAKAGNASRGLMQTIPTTFNAYAKKGYGNIYNPVDNAVAAINYIKSRYGNIDNVPGVKSIRNGGGYKPY